jgi:hypothetical protein
MLPLLLAAVATFAATPCSAQPAQSATNQAESLPDSPQGRAAAAFVEMINTGSAGAVRAFEETYRGSSQRAAVSIEERVSRVERMHADLAPLAVTRVRTRGEDQVTLVARARDGQTVVMEFIPAPEGPARIEGVRLRIGGEEIEPAAVSEATIAEIVEAAASALEEGYVFPEVGREMAEAVREKLGAGGYDHIEDDAELAAALTEDFRAVSRDLHLGVRIEPPATEAEDAAQGSMLRNLAADNYGFREVQVLPGNIGYVRFDAFVEGSDAEATAAAAMGFVRGCDAVIFDLRQNGGGSPEMIRFITSYLFEEPTHLNDMVNRDSEVVEEYWTLEDVPGERLKPGIPVYVLTSSYTFSGAEEFSYNLKNLRRGTIIGEQTGGGAHPVRGERLSDRVVIGIPFMRAQNPISKTNWEGVGVEPDVKVPSGEALERALELARKSSR